MAEIQPWVTLWEEFWKEICVNPDGSLNLDAIQRELYDYSMIMREASMVYGYVTGGKVSKPNTCADVVISMAEDYFSEAD